MTSPSPASCGPFADTAVAAFPSSLRALAQDTARNLATSVDDGYRSQSYRMNVLGENVHIPYRLHFLSDAIPRQYLNQRSLLARCLMSRSTNGYCRQIALRSILALKEAWVIPFIALPIGEYVVEIVQDIQSSLPLLDRDIYANFVRENRPAMQLLRSRAASYWDCYHRRAYPDKRAYPGMAVLNQLEQWAGG
ncbi:MAG: hypothetical protein FWC42_06510 [Proteobacteria bacterium]|nr:hypothetical protein [Pseudomonadota bacterium]